jgi:hypothetical protein
MAKASAGEAVDGGTSAYGDCIVLGTSPAAADLKKKMFILMHRVILYDGLGMVQIDCKCSLLHNARSAALASTSGATTRIQQSRTAATALEGQ